MSQVRVSMLNAQCSNCEVEVISLRELQVPVYRRMRYDVKDKMAN